MTLCQITTLQQSFDTRKHGTIPGENTEVCFSAKADLRYSLSQLGMSTQSEQRGYAGPEATESLKCLISLQPVKPGYILMETTPWAQVSSMYGVRIGI